jgi:hypothetical protein
MFLIPEKELKSYLKMKTEIQLLPSTKKFPAIVPLVLQTVVLKIALME